MNLKTSEIFSEFFEVYHNAFRDDYQRWNTPLTLSSESFSEFFVCVCVCVHARVFCLLTLALFEESSITASNQQIYDLYK